MSDNVLCIKPEHPDNFVQTAWKERYLLCWVKAQTWICQNQGSLCSYNLPLACWMDLKTLSKAIHPIAFPQKGPKSYIICQSYEQLNMMKEINASVTVISNKISLAYSESLKGT